MSICVNKEAKRKERASHPPPLTEHMDVSLGDGVEAAAGQQDDVRFGVFCHGSSRFFFLLLLLSVL